MKNIFKPLGLILLIGLTINLTVAAQDNEFNKPVSDVARQSLKRADKLAEQEKFLEALAECKKAIAKASHFVLAHVKTLISKVIFSKSLTRLKPNMKL